MLVQELDDLNFCVHDSGVGVHCASENQFTSGNCLFQQFQEHEAESHFKSTYFSVIFYRELKPCSCKEQLLASTSTCTGVYRRITLTAQITFWSSVDHVDPSRNGFLSTTSKFIGKLSFIHNYIKLYYGLHCCRTNSPFHTLFGQRYSNSTVMYTKTDALFTKFNFTRAMLC